MDKLWTAKWITDDRFCKLAPINVFHKERETVKLPSHPEHLKNQHMLVRKKFILPKKPQKVYIDISADDYYKLYINGEFVGQGPAPAYHNHYNYNRIDISKYITSDENIIAVHVYYQGLINRVWNSGDLRQGMIAEIIADGAFYLGTDDTWRYTLSEAYVSGGITGYETQFLENFDNRKYEPNWVKADYDDTAWRNAAIKPDDDHKLCLQETPMLEVYEIKPAKTWQPVEGQYILDFGSEITGQFKASAVGKSGQTIEIRCAEELNDDGSGIRYNMRSNCTYQEFWTLSGKGEDTLELYDYKAFRYVEVIDPDKAALPGSFSAVVRHYPLDENSCILDSSDKMLSSVWNICKNGVKYCSQESFVDCPGREKGQYLGDVTVAGHSHIYLSGDLRLYKKALEDFALTTSICSGLMAVAPGSLMQEFADYSLQWPMQLLLYYKQSGDLDFLRRMYPVAEKILGHFNKYAGLDGLLENVTDKPNLVDWPSNKRDDYDFDFTNPSIRGCHNVLNAFYYGCIQTVNEIKDILGIEYINKLPEMKEAFIRAYYNRDTGLFTDSQTSRHSSLHSNILPLFFNIAPEEARSSIVGFIKQKRLNCGTYMSYFLLKALAKVGEYGLVYDLITCSDTQSWGNMVLEGASTCFEAWGKDQKWNTSLCHAWSSAPIPVIIEDILGITPGKPGWEEISFNPHMPEALGSLTLEFNVKTGRIKVEYKDGTVSLTGPFRG